jgi:fatty-acyl-CoA synthase
MYPGTHATTAPERIAAILQDTGEELTYAALDDRSARLARVLHDQGVRPGDVVALMLENRLECFEIYWAAIRSGLIVTPINWHLAVAEVAAIVDDCGARVMFASPAVAEVAREVAGRCRRVELRCAVGGGIDGWRDYEELLAAAGARLSAQPRGVEMLYSSGTTGRPKGIEPVMPGGEVDEPGHPLVTLAQRRYGIGPGDVYLSPAPLYHAAPLRWAAAVQALGGTVVVLARFDAAKVLETIEERRVTVAQMVPTMFGRLLRLPEDVRTGHDLSTLRLVLHAGAPCPRDVKRSMIDWWGPVIEEYYGNTEGNTLTFISSAEWLEHPGSVGRSALGTVHICGDDGATLPAGVPGEIYVERESMPFRYHNAPELTAAARHPEHPTWTTVGDCGYLDEDGYLYLTGRKSFMIISGGVNIQPREVEDVLLLHPGVADAAVIGVPDPDMGEQVRAVVQPRPGTAADERTAAELVEFVRARIARFKAPRSVRFVAEIPRTETGKLLRGSLDDGYAGSPPGHGSQAADN